MEEDKVNLVRRASGGGAVYQDLGNSIFTFISPKLHDNSININRNNEIIVGALANSGITNAAATGRNDLEVNGLKISGAAFKHSKEKSLHHGTLLIDVDMTALSKYLTPNKLKMQSKGIASVAARVTNIKDITTSPIDHDIIGRALTQSFFKMHNGSCEVVDIDENIQHTEPIVRQTLAELQDWAWRFGKEPNMTHNLEVRFAWGTFDVNLEVHKGVIMDAVLHTDTLDTGLVDQIRLGLISCEYSKSGIAQGLAAAAHKLSGSSVSVDNINEFSGWLSSQIM